MNTIGEQDNGKAPEMRVLGELSKPASPDNVAPFLDFVSSHGRELGFSDKRVREIEAAVEQALTNIIERAFEGATGSIHVTCNIDPRERFVVVIVDEGKPFNMLLAGSRFFDDEPEERKVATGTLKKMIDDIEYRRVENTNMLTLIAAKNVRSKQ